MTFEPLYLESLKHLRLLPGSLNLISHEERISERRLGAIMFTDLVGYSSMTSVNEKRALQLLGEHRRLLQSVFPNYEGRVVKTIGDAFLVEFQSAVEAVNCAAEVQKQVHKFNSERRTEEKILVRIGIHVGDIVHSEGDVLGDAVNIAARVEPLAEPGGICLTRQVVDQIEKKVEYQIIKVGMRELKNIPSPVEIYKIVLPLETSRLNEKIDLDPHRIAILPFANMSADPNDRYFAEGMTEELISTVSKISELGVISRTSAMRYRDTTLTIAQIGQELSVGTLLEGSVRKSGNRVRITAQLIEVKTDRHLWSQSYDRDLTDVFAIQGDIAEQVAEALRIKLLSKEKAIIEKKATDNPEAYTLYLKGRYYWNERIEEGIKKAITFFEKALNIDPRFAMAYSGLADCYAILADYGWMLPNEAGRLAKDYATKALELDDTLAEAHASLALTLMNNFWDFASCERELKRAIELRPNYAAAYHWNVIMLDYLERFEEAYEMEKRALELDPYSRVMNMGLGIQLFGLGKIDQSIDHLGKVVDQYPNFAPAYLWKSSVHACVSQYDQAIESAKKSIELEPKSAIPKLNLAWVYAVAGRIKDSEKLLDQVLSGTAEGSFPGWIGAVKLSQGKEDEGFESLERALRERDSLLFTLKSSPMIRKYHNDPRWIEIERKLDLLIHFSDSKTSRA